MNDTHGAGAVQIAATWRASQPEARQKSGVVLVFGGEAYGWKNELRDPHHERPGALAVDHLGNFWIAEGGDDYNGAKRWRPGVENA